MSDQSFHETKSLLTSRAVWSNVVGFVCLIVSIFGVDGGVIDQGAVAEALLQVATGVAFVASTIFRVVATHRLRP